MQISILFLGDVVGEPGRKAVAELLPQLREEFQPDLVVANLENATHGKGVSLEHWRELRDLGIEVATGGDHSWQTKSLEVFDDPGVLRPANYQGPGKGYVDVVVKGKRIRVLNLIGTVFTGAYVPQPFAVADEILKRPGYDLAIVDFHAEATSEKRMLAEYLDGRVSLLVGTHTHVPTADAQVLPKGTAFITDLGMVGPTQSSLGAEPVEVLQHFLTGRPWRYSVGAGKCELGAVIAHIDAGTGQASNIQHIRRFTQTF